MGDRTLMIGAILVGLVVAAIVWFAAISPKLSSTQAAKEATVTQLDENFRLETTLAERKSSAKNVPEYTREIYAIRDILPPSEDIPTLRRTINGIISSLGLSIEIESINPSEPIIGGLTLVAPMAEVGLTSEIEGMAFSTLQVTTFNLEFEGTLGKISQAIEALQSQEGQYILILNLNLTASEEGVGNLYRAVIQAAVFTLDDGVAGLTIRPDERPWPGTEEETLVEPDEPVVVPVAPAEG